MCRRYRRRSQQVVRFRNGSDHVNDRYEPMKRSTVWLSEPADAAAWAQVNEQASRAIASLSILERCKIVSDRNQPERIRWHALCGLPVDDVTRLLGDLLWEDSDDYWTRMIDFSQLDTERIRSGLDRHRNSSIMKNRLAAIKALSILKDISVVVDIDEVLKQTQTDDSPGTFVAIHALGRLACSESRDRLTALVSDGNLTHSVRVAAAEEMLFSGPVDLAYEYLRSVAATCCGMEASSAARAIRTVDRREGTRLMLAILENGDDDARQTTVLNVSSEMENLDAPFNSDGLKLARDYLRSLISE